MKRLVVELDDKLHASIKVLCAKRGIPMRKVLTGLLIDWKNNKAKKMR